MIDIPVHIKHTTKSHANNAKTNSEKLWPISCKKTTTIFNVSQFDNYQ